MKWARNRFAIEMLDEPTYSFASTDNVRAYDKELLLARRHTVSSRHGLVSFVDDSRAASIVIGAGGGPTRAHERSAVVVDDLCVVAVGLELVCLTVPSLDLRWHHEADPASCFGVHPAPNERAVIAHGELEVSKWAFDGERLWSFGGADIFTGALSIIGETVVVEDFDGRTYRIELRTGRGVLGSATGANVVPRPQQQGRN